MEDRLRVLAMSGEMMGARFPPLAPVAAPQEAILLEVLRQEVPIVEQRQVRLAGRPLRVALQGAMLETVLRRGEQAVEGLPPTLALRPHNLAARIAERLEQETLLAGRMGEASLAVRLAAEPLPAEMRGLEPQADPTRDRLEEILQAMAQEQIQRAAVLPQVEIILPVAPTQVAARQVMEQDLLNPAAPVEMMAAPSARAVPQGETMAEVLPPVVPRVETMADLLRRGVVRQREGLLILVEQQRAMERILRREELREAPLALAPIQAPQEMTAEQRVRGTPAAAEIQEVVPATRPVMEIQIQAEIQIPEIQEEAGEIRKLLALPEMTGQAQAPAAQGIAVV